MTRLLRSGPDSGVTILEVLVASAVLAMGLVGVGSMVTFGVISHHKSQNYTIATARATQELERIREAGYLGAQVGSGLFPSPGYTILDSTRVSFSVPELEVGTGLISLEEDIQAIATNPGTGLPYANLKKALVRISWGGGRSLRGSYQAVTLVANRP